MPYRIKSQLENINFFKVFLYSSTSIWYSPATVLLLHFPVLSHVSSVRWTSSPSHSKKYIDHLLDSSKRISYCTTEYGIFFCSLKVDYPKNGTIVFGPLTNIPYTESDLQQLYRDYTVPNNDCTGFHRFLRQIPCLSMNSLLKKCLFFNYCLHGELLTLDQLISSDASMQTTLTDASLLEETYQTKENEQHNQTYAIEEQILNLVKTGNYQEF